MKDSNLKTKTQENIQQEIIDFITRRKTLQLASINPEGLPFSSYAPFAIGENCLYVLLSEIALHAINLKTNKNASALIIEDEDSADELFARIRVNYSLKAELIEPEAKTWQEGIDTLQNRHGERIKNLSALSDFCLFKLVPQGGRYVKGFARAYTIEGNTLSGTSINHMRDGHKKRDAA